MPAGQERAGKEGLAGLLGRPPWAADMQLRSPKPTVPGRRVPDSPRSMPTTCKQGARGEVGRREGQQGGGQLRARAQRHQQWRRGRGRRPASHHRRWAWRPAHCARMRLACPWRPSSGGAGPGQPAPRSGRLQGGAPRLQARRATIVQPRRRSGREAGGARGGNPPHPLPALAFSAFTTSRPLRRPADAGRNAARVRALCLPLPPTRPPATLARCC